MAKLNDVLAEALAKLITLDTGGLSLAGKVVIADDENDLLDLLKGIKSYPAVGIIYEGMRSLPEAGSTNKLGISAEIVVAFVLISTGGAIHRTDQKRIRAVEYLEAMRDLFMGVRSTATGHFWHFLVEAPTEVKTGMLVWVQRWTIPVQLPPLRH